MYMFGPTLDDIMRTLGSLPQTSCYGKGKIGIKYTDFLKAMRLDYRGAAYVKEQLKSLEMMGKITLLYMEPPNDDLFYAIQINSLPGKAKGA